MAALPDDRTALLEFVASEGAPITVFIVQRTGITARVLPAFDSLGATIDRFSALVESGADAARLGRALGRALLDSARALLDPKVTRLVVVPDGPLHRLPFDALRLADGRYVLERYALGAAPSASVVIALGSRRPAASSAPARLLAFGDPAIPPQLVRARGASNGDGEPYLTAVRASGGLPRLRGASREARQVARYAAEADVRTGADASAAFLRRSDLRQYRVRHFAAHAIVDEPSVAGTALVLAPGEGYSGFVDPGDLATLTLNADLVVLSACSAARGVLIRGEGLQGLTSPLLQAGARAVIATEWRIRDGEAVPFVETLYEELARGLPVVEALRAAKLRAIRGGAPPSTWAAFAAIGDPLNVVPLRARPERWWSRLLR